mgnify:FL=1
MNIRRRTLPNTDLEPRSENPLAVAVAANDPETLSIVRHAVDRQEVVLAFQPVIQARQPDRPAFYEGLIRIYDDRGRVIPAGDFIDAVEATETGRIIDCLSLDMGLMCLAESPSLRLSINMSARSIGYPRWTNVLKRGLAVDPTIAERLILEITEASAMLMPDLVTVFMRDLQRQGVAFALDDFGAGHTSFRYLRQFYFDIIKIDGQFIRGVAVNPDNQVLTAALVSIARHFDMFTVAESVETGADAEYLQALGIDCLQGYFFGPPTIMPPWKTPAAQRRA